MFCRFLARLKKLQSFCWRLLRRVSGAGQWGARGAGAPTGGRVASIFLGGRDPFQPENPFYGVFVAKNSGFPIRVCPKQLIRHEGNAILRYMINVFFPISSSIPHLGVDEVLEVVGQVADAVHVRAQVPLHRRALPVPVHVVRHERHARGGGHLLEHCWVGQRGGRRIGVGRGGRRAST
jgi:hypothetical protein